MNESKNTYRPHRTGSRRKGTVRPRGKTIIPHLVTRGIFYVARMISAQMDVEFTADDYDGIKKVYFIWVCMNAPKYAMNTITGYSIQPEKIYGDFQGKARYDLLSVITICLGNRDCENELLGMLSSLLSPELTPDQKETVLQEYGIATTQLKEEMSAMCNLSDLIEERGIEKGIRALVESFKELGLSKDDASSKIVEKFSATEKAAKMYVEKYWENCDVCDK